MAIMAVTASGRVSMPCFEREPMDARVVALYLLRMTSSTVRRPSGEVIVGMPGCDVRVTTRARIGLVNGCVQFGHVHEQGNLFAARVCGRQHPIGMALHAGTAVYGSRDRRRTARAYRRSAGKASGCHSHREPNPMRSPDAHAMNIRAQTNSDLTCLGQ